MENKKTLVLGATTRPTRYAFLATSRLQEHEIEVVPVGIREGEINGEPILLGQPSIDDVHTVTLYLLKPKRIIFNPGTENAKLSKLAREQGIETVIGCTLVMLSLKNY